MIQRPRLEWWKRWHPQRRITGAFPMARLIVASPQAIIACFGIWGSFGFLLALSKAKQNLANTLQKLPIFGAALVVIVLFWLIAHLATRWDLPHVGCPSFS